MRRINGYTSREEILDYNLRDNGSHVSVFEQNQWFRVNITRQRVQAIIDKSPDKNWVIYEPACSAGDIAGYFSEQGHAVFGNDLVPAAYRATKERWPKMTIEHAAAEDVEPMACDILIMCEFLEHIWDPVGFVEAWAPHARYMVISHPLVRDGNDHEKGHAWAYDEYDFWRWFELGGHRLTDITGFRMGYEMILGAGERA